MPQTRRRTPELRNMKSWTGRVGHSNLRSFTDDDGHLWLEQNPEKNSKWAKLARQGHEIAWEFEAGSYTGRMLIDGEIYTPSQATKKFIHAQDTSKRLKESRQSGKRSPK